jgi:Fe-Mn family superoxide dismutase
MRVNKKFVGFNVDSEDEQLLDNFISFLKRKLPLKKDITIEFLKSRYGKMSTGSRTNKHIIKILVKDRMNRDILRTIAHEWAHEYQRTIENMEKGPDIGGKNENKANERSGELVKRFERRHKKDEKTIYSLFNERIKELEKLINEDSVSKTNIITEIKKITIEKLPYEFDSLSSFIDDETMKTHYNKHYKGYVEKLNLELEKMSGKDIDLIDIIKKISKFNKKVKNNGGGAFNHALFWKMLSPKRTELKNPLLFKIEKTFGSLEEFKEKFEEMAKTRFGSGWVWLIINKNNNLKIVTTPNQDNPLMDTEKNGGYPLLGLDLWEHAYYLKYKSERDKYIHNFWKVVNWDFVSDQYVSQTKKKLNESISTKKIFI